MNITDLPAPDDVVEIFLTRIFGPAAVIVVLFQLCILVGSWNGAIQAGRKIGPLALGARRAAARILEVGWVARLSVLAALLGGAAVLPLWVALSSTMGHGASYLVHLVSGMHPRTE